MKKLNFFGAGPKIGRIVLPYLAIAIVLTILFPSVFKFGEGVKIYLMVIGMIFLGIGLVLYGLTARSLLRGIKETRLVTTGMYRYSQNPLYALIMLVLFPGIGLMMNSWLVLTTPVLGFICFRKFIAQEYNEMTDVFGEEYQRYKERTPEFFPFIR